MSSLQTDPLVVVSKMRVLGEVSAEMLRGEVRKLELSFGRLDETNEKLSLGQSFALQLLMSQYIVELVEIFNEAVNLQLAGLNETGDTKEREKNGEVAEKT